MRTLKSLNINACLFVKNNSYGIYLRVSGYSHTTLKILEPGRSPPHFLMPWSSQMISKWRFILKATVSYIEKILWKLKT